MFTSTKRLTLENINVEVYVYDMRSYQFLKF